MGDPAELTPQQRYEANELAKAMVDAVVNDESMVDAICDAAFGAEALGFKSPEMSEDEEAVLLRLAQQNRDLRDALISACTKWNRLWMQVNNEDERATKPPAEIAELLAIARPVL